ncbi:MAG TPA: hypothetical protein VLJ14_01560 [Ktedonobacterales bacterium]|jgi:hypothetical protein|nr:hypothetical protein [Ktedonobacterales bacterium]
MGKFREADLPDGFAPRWDVVDLDDAFGEHHIEYWVRKQNALVPATEREIAAIRAWEREHTAALRLERLKQVEHRRRRLQPLWAAWQMVARFIAWATAARMQGVSPNHSRSGSE